MNKDEATIRKMFEETYPDNVRSGIGQQYASLYTEDAWWMPPSAPMAKGPESIAAHADELNKAMSINPTIEIEELQMISESSAYVIATPDLVITPKDGSDNMTANLRVFWLLTKASGDWKISRQIWHERVV